MYAKKASFYWNKFTSTVDGNLGAITADVNELYTNERRLLPFFLRYRWYRAIFMASSSSIGIS